MWFQPGPHHVPSCGHMDNPIGPEFRFKVFQHLYDLQVLGSLLDEKGPKLRPAATVVLIVNEI